MRCTTWFRKWNSGPLDSYLIEITADILGYRDEKGEALVEKILDTAGQKGTGKWTAVNALDMGIPVTLIGEAVFSRYLSALKEERVEAAGIIKGPDATFSGNRDEFLMDLESALLASKIISYAQGFMLMREAAKEFGWKLNYGEIALMWRGGCIIRSVFLGKIKDAFDRKPDLKNLIIDNYFRKILENAQTSWRRIVSKAAELGIPAPAMSTGFPSLTGIEPERLPANWCRHRGDYFGAHTYERVDEPRGKILPYQLGRKGGRSSSSTLKVNR